MLEPYRIDDFFNLDAGTSQQSEDPLFSLFLDDDFSKLPPAYDLALPVPSPAPSSSTSSHSPFPAFAIDPQLVGTPATSKALSDFDEDDPHSDDELPPAPRSKPSRKGTVMSGGIKKASSPEKENKDKAKRDPAPLRILEPEDWRPSPEEYKKMSSKEKRQLRNKISARNFRVRRKEYITTLEGDIAERDRLIDAIRSELGSSKSENIALRQEIAALKKCLLEGRALPDLPPPADLPPVPASPPLTPPAAPVATSSPVLTPNTHKDLPTSPRLSNRAFWGGLGGMGVTPVHTTFVPPIAALASKPSPTPFSPILKPSIFYEETIRSRVLQENLNPGLNPATFHGQVERKGAANINPSLNHGIAAFDNFSDINPFTFKTLDAYRMQLWGKMAAQQHAHQSQSQPQPFTQPHGLASNLKPHFFNSASKSKAASQTPPASPKLPSREHAAAAAIASQTLFSKLGSAFWEAFSGSSSSHASAPKHWDAEKVRKVLEGRAVVRVVDIDAPAPPRVPSPAHSVSSTSSHMSLSAKTDRPSCKDCLTDILEESMRSLTLSKK